MSIRPGRALCAVILTLLLTAALGTAPAAAADGGAISGQLLDGTAPVAGATVALLHSSGVALKTAPTDADGRFRLAGILPGSYKLRFDLPYGFLQFHPGQETAATATVITVTGSEEQTITEYARPHGSLGGRITTAAGAPVANAYVQLLSATGTPVGTVYTDAAGTYLFPYVKAGDYKLAAAAARYGAPVQYAPDKATSGAAPTYAVTTGARTTLDESLLPLGQVTGSYTMGGRKLANVRVEAFPTAGGVSMINRTEADGSFRLWLRPGTYQLHFDPADGEVDQWWRGRDVQSDADVITVAEDATVVADETALPEGRAVGRVVAADGGDPGFLTVEMTDVTTGRTYRTSTPSGGEWSLRLHPGRYLVRYETTDQIQWANGKTSAEGAEVVVVTADTDTTLTETLLPLSTVTVTATDATSGARVTTFCATLQGSGRYENTCTTDGAVAFRTGEGTYTVTVDDQVHLINSVADVRVAGGESRTVNVPLRRAGTIDVTVVDARTGAAVSGVCLNTVPVGRPPYFAEGNSACTGSDGRLTLPRVLPDRYNLFAGAYDGEHGSQWVGAAGGVGSQAAARVLTVRGGITSRVTVRLDGAGTISGVVTDRATGRPVADVTVEAGGKGTGTDADGRYTIDGLGPYSWPLLFTHADYAGQWSGGGTNRLTATGIRVKVNTISSYDVRLRTGTLIAGTATGPGGRALDWGFIKAVNAETYDVMAYVQVGTDGRYRLRAAGPQRIKLLFDGSVAGSWVQRWYPTATDFPSGRTISVPTSGSLTADFTITP
ncbi:hypothetical protein GCM10009682_31610 [Luedemannella flava]|uniref:Alpha-amylase n=1 Tax=Luedemannella flava TaxID=349316 RepID=A0ABN2M3M8_9ACTN